MLRLCDSTIHIRVEHEEIRMHYRLLGQTGLYVSELCLAER